MILIYLTIWGFMLAAGVSAVWALVWSMNHGHFADTEAQARSILDADDHEKPSADLSLSVQGD
jgi:cbb3-type cytochrome oxidase maturation protein